MLTKVERQTLLLHELAALGETLVRIKAGEAPEMLKEETGPVPWRVPCWRLQRSHTSFQHTCQGPEI